MLPRLKRSPLLPASPLPRAFLPPVEPGLPVEHRRCLVVPVGPTGDLVLAQARPSGPWVPVASCQDPAAWRGAFAAVLRHAGPERLVPGGGRVEVVVVGSPEKVAGAWNDVRSHLEVFRGANRVEVVILEVGGASGDASTWEPAGDCLGHFRIGRVYANGTLTEAEAVALAARLLGSGLTRYLFEFARAHDVRGPVLLGVTLGWLPEVSLGEALARHLEAALAGELLRSGDAVPPRLPTLFRPSALAALDGRLRAGLEQESAALLARLETTYRQTPVRELDDEVQPDDPGCLAGVADWCARARQGMASALSRASRDVAGFPAARAMLSQAVHHLGEVRAELARKERLLRGQRQRATRRAKDQDERRLRCRRCFFLWRPICSWWATWGLRRRLAEFGRARVAEALLGYAVVALDRLLAETEALAARLAELREQAERASERLEALLRPDHPSLLALQDVAALRCLLDVLSASFPSRQGQSGVERVWELAVAELFQAEVDGDGSWLPVRRAAGAVARSWKRKAEPLTDGCRALLSRYREETLRDHLSRAARTLEVGRSGRAWVERQLLVEQNPGEPRPHRGHGASLPGVFCFRWQEPDAGEDGERVR